MQAGKTRKGSRLTHLTAAATTGLLAVGMTVVAAVPSGASAEVHAKTSKSQGHKAKTKAVNKKPWVIGAIADLTGPDAAEGASVKAAMTYEFNSLNKGGGVNGRKLSLDYCDTSSTPTGGAQCGTRLATVNSHMILLLSSTPITIGAVSQIPHDIGIAFVPNLFPKSGTNIFQAAPLEKAEVDPMMAQAKSSHLTTMGVMYTSDATGSSLLKAVTAEAPHYGIKIVSQPMVPGAVDVTPQLAQLKSQGAQFIFSATIGANTNAVLSSYHTLGLTLPFVLEAGDVANAFLRSLSFALPSRLYGLTVMDEGPGFPTGITKAWVALTRNFKKATGEPVDQLAAGVVTTGCIAARVLLRTNGKSGPAEVKWLADHEVSCFGAGIRFNVPGLNVASGIPGALVQAGKTASSGFGPVRNKL